MFSQQKLNHFNQYDIHAWSAGELLIYFPVSLQEESTIRNDGGDRVPTYGVMALQAVLRTLYYKVDFIQCFNTRKGFFNVGNP